MTELTEEHQDLLQLLYVAPAGLIQADLKGDIALANSVFNSALQLIKANARGFRNFTNYRARILFHCGKLNLAMA